MISAPRFVFGIGLVTLVAGCPVLDVAIEVEEVCVTYPDVAVDGQPGALQVTRSFAIDDLDGIRDLVEHHADVEFVRAEVRAKTGVSDFAFVDAARVIIATGDAESALPPLTVYDCDGNCLPEGNRLSIPASLQQSA